MPISINSTDSDILSYLRMKHPSLVSSFPIEHFSGIDGEIFFGVNISNIDYIFPSIPPRDKGLLLARIESLRSASNRPLLTSPSSPPPAPPVSHYELESSRHAPATSSCRVPLSERFSTSYSRSYSPTVRSEGGSGADDYPRILLELWVSSEGGRTEFAAECWLPELAKFNKKNEIMRIGLKRNIKLLSSDGSEGRVTQSRKWFGTVLISGEMENEKSFNLNLIEIRDLGEILNFNFYHFNCFYYINNKFHFIHKTNQNANFKFHEIIKLKFNKPKTNPSLPLPQPDYPDYTPPGVPVRDHRSPSPKPPGGTPPPWRTSDMEISAPTQVVSEGARGRSLSSGRSSVDCLVDIITSGGRINVTTIAEWAERGEWVNLSPRYNRFEGFLLPTHETTALFGSVYTLQSTQQIENLRNNSNYSQNHKIVIKCLLQYFTTDWSGHSWLLRHCLLSSILIGSRDTTRGVISLVRSLEASRRLDMNENGLGEVLFTLNDDKSESDKFWNNLNNLKIIKNDFNIPQIRLNFSQLINYFNKEIL
jgi:hypothetical protein